MGQPKGFLVPMGKGSAQQRPGFARDDLVGEIQVGRDLFQSLPDRDNRAWPVRRHPARRRGGAIPIREQKGARWSI